jgi:hypothetical protein
MQGSVVPSKSKCSIWNLAPSKGFYVACEDIKATRRTVLYPGDERFNLNRKIEVMPLAALFESELGGDSA